MLGFREHSIPVMSSGHYLATGILVLGLLEFSAHSSVMFPELRCRVILSEHQHGLGTSWPLFCILTSVGHLLSPEISCYVCHCVVYRFHSCVGLLSAVSLSTVHGALGYCEEAGPQGSFSSKSCFQTVVSSQQGLIFKLWKATKGETVAYIALGSLLGSTDQQLGGVSHA